MREADLEGARGNLVAQLHASVAAPLHGGLRRSLAEDKGGVAVDNFVAYLISIAAGVTVTVLARPAWLLISGVAQMVFSDLPRISGRWTVTFTEPTESRESENMTETISLRQLGRIVWGEGTVADSRNRVFKYRGSILRNTLHGTYRVKGSNAPAGTGTFQLQIAGSDCYMEGWCLWYDRDTEDIEASPYKWTKQS